MSDLDERLAWAAERACGAKARWDGIFPIVETFRGEIVWEGVVTRFDSDHGRVCAWAVKGDNEPQYVAVLHKPPVTDALTAVRAWLVTEARKK